MSCCCTADKFRMVNMKETGDLMECVNTFKENGRSLEESSKNHETEEIVVTDDEVETIIIDEEIDNNDNKEQDCNSSGIIEITDCSTDIDVIDLDEYTGKSSKRRKKYNNSENDIILIDEMVVIDDEKENRSSQGNELVDEHLLVLHKSQPNPLVDSQNNLTRIQEIEHQIASFKKSIVELEEAEVTDDTKNSPYFRSEQLKAVVVKLHKELCQLTGIQAVKRREVKLKVLDGHPPAPVKKLEVFINNNISSDGVPPFPDFRDVVECVVAANIEDDLNWSQMEIMNEATALFTQCGRALQKKRQKREWRDLIKRFKSEPCDNDPADEDLELFAKLEANKRVAMKKEHDVFERFTRLQYQSPQSTTKVSTGMTSDNVQTASEVIKSLNSGKIQCRQSTLSYTNTSNVNNVHDCHTGENVIHQSDLDENESYCDDSSSENSDLEGSIETNVIQNTIALNNRQVTDEKFNNASQTKVSGNETSRALLCNGGPYNDMSQTLLVNEGSNSDTPVTLLVSKSSDNDTSETLLINEGSGNDTSQTVLVNKVCGNALQTSLSDNEDFVKSGNDTSQVKVKSEPKIDIIKMLEELGDNYTTTIVDIEDPFLVIEISSDSSSDESGGEFESRGEGDDI